MKLGTYQILIDVYDQEPIYVVYSATKPDYKAASSRGQKELGRSVIRIIEKLQKKEQN